MRYKLLFIFIFMVLTSSAVTESGKPELYVDGRYLYTPAGKKLIFPGFNATIVYRNPHSVLNFPETEQTGASSVNIFRIPEGWSLPAAGHACMHSPEGRRDQKFLSIEKSSKTDSAIVC